VARLKKIFSSSRNGTHIKHVLNNEDFEKMRKMWLGLGIVVVGLPPLVAA